MDKNLQKILDNLRKDPDFADCTEEELLEVAQMELGAKDVKMYVSDVENVKTKKPRTVKISDEKTELFTEILENLQEIYKENVKILKENKLISVKINDLTFKIDIIQERVKKS